MGSTNKQTWISCEHVSVQLLFFYKMYKYSHISIEYLIYIQYTINQTFCSYKQENLIKNRFDLILLPFFPATMNDSTASLVQKITQIGTHLL